MSRVFKYIANTVWWLTLLSVVAVSASLVLFLQFSPYISKYRPQIEKNLTQIIGYPISIGHIEASLNGMDPVILVEDISLMTTSATTGSTTKPIVLESLTIQLNLLQTLLTFEPNFSLLRFNSPRIELVEQQGNWFVPGMNLKQDNETGGFLRLLNYVLQQDHMSVLNLKVNIDSEIYQQFQLSSDAIYMQKSRRGLGLSGSIHHSDYAHDFLFDAEWLGNLSRPESLELEAALVIPPIWLNTDKWLNNNQLKLDNIQLGGNIWLSYKPYDQLLLSGHLNSVLEAFRTKDYHLNSDFRLTYDLFAQTIEAELVHLSIQQEDKVYPQSNLSIFSDLSNESLNLDVRFDRFDLALANEALTPYLDSSLFVSQMLKSMAPKGEAKNAQLTIQQSEEFEFHYRSNLSVESVLGYDNIPSADNIEAIIDVSHQEGELAFVSDNSTIHFPLLFDSSWLADTASGVIAWRDVQDAFVVQGRDLFFHRHGADMHGTFYVEIPEDQEGALQLDLHFSNGDLIDKGDYIPKDTLPLEAEEWIDQSVLSGKVMAADLSIYVPFSENAEPRVLLEADVEDAAVNFADDWPTATDVTGSLLYDAEGVSAYINQATIQEVDVEDIEISLPFTSDGEMDKVNIEGEIAEELSHTLALLRSTSLAEDVLEPFESWQARGDFEGSFNISIPLTDELEPPEPDLDLQLTFKNNFLRIDDLDLPIHVYSGDISYNTATGIDKNSHVEAAAFGGDANIKLSSLFTDEQELHVIAQIEGKAGAYEVAKWLEFPDALTDALSGEAEYLGNINVNRRHVGEVEMSLESTLFGVESALPKPLFKAADTIEPIKVNVISYEDMVSADIDYQAHHARLAFAEEGFYGGHVFVNRQSNYQEALPEGLSVEGELLLYDHSDWEAFFERLSEQQADDLPKFTFLLPDWVSKVSLIADTVAIDEDNQLNNVKIAYDQTLAEQGYQFSSDEVSFKVTEDSHGPVVHFDYLSWSTGEDDEEDSEELPFKAAQIPNMTLLIDELYLDTKPYGDWSMVITSEGDRLRVDPISSKLQGGTIAGRLFWQDDADNANVQLVLNIEGQDLRQFSQKFTKNEFMSSEEFDVSILLNWLGHPFDLDEKSLSGRINILAENGRIEAVENMPTFLKTLGIFNLNALSRRLTLDFSDVSLPGLTYDSISANLAIHDGILDTVEPMELISPTANFVLEGKADLVSETLDEKVTASFPLGGTLPVASLLLGATPQIAGLLYITDKMLGGVLSKVTSVQYSITGPFAEPIIEPIDTVEE